MRPSCRAGKTGAPVTAALRVAVVAIAFAGGCVEDSGLMVITQNQIPLVDTTAGTCTVSTASEGGMIRTRGVLDLGTGQLASYFVYPLIVSRLAPLATVVGGHEPNAVMLRGVTVTLKPPVGYSMTWKSDCPNTLEDSLPAPLPPGGSVAGSVRAIIPCQSEQILAEFRPGGLNPDLSEFVYFEAQLRAIGSRSSGDEITSDVFRFPIRVCVGCLQTNFPDLAQFNYPGVPQCSVAPRPNMHKGNPCNIAQDFGPLLCCLDDNNKPVCPSPDL